MKVELTQEMNERIVKLLRESEDPEKHYAAARILELEELDNAHRGRWGVC